MTEKLKELTMEFERTKKRILGVAALVYVLFIVFFLMFVSSCNTAKDDLQRVTGPKVSQKASKGSFALIEKNEPAQLVLSANEFPGVELVMGYFSTDLEMVSGKLPVIHKGEVPSGKGAIIAGTLGKSELIEQLVAAGKIDAAMLAGKNEMFIIQVIDQPFEGLEKALVVTGSDKRGTMYGIFEISKQMGVSPWNWWADVPVQQYANLYFSKGVHTEGEPKVKYRGIFLNDEEPALGRWAVANYGGFTSGFYEKLFELMLRMKANFLWPAMWWASFNDNDPMNAVLANELGIVMGTSHHEPLNRAHADWRKYGQGPWNYETNTEVLKDFWRQGIENTKEFETIITLAMRGDGDEAMTQETNIALLQSIVADQRQIIEEVTGKPITEVPQVWALYKEVQDYYDQGMRVPDDVTLLLCDDNWGNIRKLPRLDYAQRAGGYGIYYHYDYVGGPRNYKWLNTSPIYRTWEQMNLAYRHGVDRIWVVNVGDLKPMEFPIEFFLDMAWDPDRYHAGNLYDYTKQWAQNQFGKKYGEKIAELIDGYTRYNSRRKPELLQPETYSHIHYGEAMRIVDEYRELEKKSTKIYQALPENYRDAYFQLVQYPVEACATVNEMYVAIGQNHTFARQGRVVANELAQRAIGLFEKDSLMSHYYNKEMAGGKWNNMMNQTRIGYTYWQQPPHNVMPKTATVVAVEGAEMGVAIEGSAEWWPNSESSAVLPTIDPYHKQKYYIDIFNRGNQPFEAVIECNSPLIKVSLKKANVEQQARIWVEAKNLSRISERTQVPIKISGPGQAVVEVMAVVDPLQGIDAKAPGFIEANGFVAIEAGNVSRIVSNGQRSWEVIPYFGRTHSGIHPIPVNMAGVESAGQAACIEYDLQLTSSGQATVNLVLAPTLNIYGNDGLRIAVSFNNDEAVVLNMHDWQTFQHWEESVRTNTIVLKSVHQVEAGKNTLKVWALDPAVVLQRIIVDTGGLKPSYLGPQQSYKIAEK